MNLGANAFDIALLGAVFSLSQMVLVPLLGSLSDRHGRKSILLCGYLGNACVNLMLSRTTCLWQLLVIQVFSGVASGTSPVETAYLMELTANEEELNSIFLLQRVTLTIGALLGPLVAKAVENSGFQMLCYINLIVYLVSVYVGMAFLNDRLPSCPGSPQAGRESTPLGASPKVGMTSSLTPTALKSQSSKWCKLLTGRGTGVMLAASFAMSAGSSITEGSDPVFLRDHFGYGQDQMSNLILTTSVVTLLTTPVMPILQSLFPKVKGYVAGCIGLCLMTLCLVLGSNTRSSWVPCACAGLALGVFDSLLALSFMSLASDHCKNDSLGTFLGLNSFVSNLAALILPLIGGFFYRIDNFLNYGIRCGFFAVGAGIMASIQSLPRKAADHEETEPLHEDEDVDTDDALSPLPVSPLPCSASLYFGRRHANDIFCADENLRRLFYRRLQPVTCPKAVSIDVENFSSSASAYQDARPRFQASKTLSFSKN